MKRSTMIAQACAAALVLLGGAAAAEDVSAMARGARLYDKWWAENKAPEPTGNHPLYANEAGKYDGATSWRCKECHGWDLKGKDGAYAKGKHFTGIIGVTGAAGADPATIASAMRGAHAYTEAMLSDADLSDIALFVTGGQIDYAPLLADGKPNGDGAQGEIYFNTVCAGCHGKDGKKISTAPPLGSVAGNAVEMLHKVMNGQPGEAMPALRALDHQVAADIAVHLQTLPQ